LPTHAFIHAILDGIEVLVTRYLGLGEVVYNQKRVLAESRDEMLSDFSGLGMR
jgi:hypothetical protein